MNGVPVAPRRVFGVTLAAGDDCGDRTWVCRAHPGSGGIRVESVVPLSRLPGGEVDPGGACSSLVAKVMEAPRSAWGFDFAFGLGEDGDDGLRRTDRERGLPGPLSEPREATTRLTQSRSNSPVTSVQLSPPSVLTCTRPSSLPVHSRALSSGDSESVVSVP